MLLRRDSALIVHKCNRKLLCTMPQNKQNSLKKTLAKFRTDKLCGTLATMCKNILTA